MRLRGDDGAEQVLLAGHLMAAVGFQVLGTEPLPAVEPFGLLDTLPDEVLADAPALSAMCGRRRVEVVGIDQVQGLACSGT